MNIRDAIITVAWVARKGWGATSPEAPKETVFVYSGSPEQAARSFCFHALKWDHGSYSLTTLKPPSGNVPGSYLATRTA